MKMSEKTLLKKIEQAFEENCCNGSYKVEVNCTLDDVTSYVLFYTYETGEIIALDIDVTRLGEVKFYSPVHCYYISNFNNHTKSVINVLRMLFDLIDSNKKEMINYYAVKTEETEETEESEEINETLTKPEWHHVSLATLANIDFDMLDEKRKLVCNINQILKDGIRNLYKCENHISFEVLERYVIRKCDELIRHNRLKAFWFSYIARQLDEVRRNTIYLYTPYITAHRNRC